MLLDRVIEWPRSDAARPKKYRLVLPLQYSKTDSSRLAIVATTINQIFIWLCKSMTNTAAQNSMDVFNDSARMA